MVGSGPPEVANPTDEIAPSVDPSLVEMVGGEPGLFEHILTFLVHEDSTSDERVLAGTSAIRWLQVCKQTKQLVRSELWVLLTATYYPNYPLPKLGYVYASTLFREMWYRHKEFAKAKAQVRRLNADLHGALQVMRVAWQTPLWRASERRKWEIGTSRVAALSDMEWRESFLHSWDGVLTPVPVRRQNAGVAH